MRARVLLVVALLALASAACSDGNGDDDSPAATSTSPAAVTTLPAGTTTPATTTTLAPTGVVLRPDGLAVVDFGATKAATVVALTAAFGPVDETGTGCELAGPDVTTSRWDELRVQFVGTSFDSYNVRPPNGVEPVLGLETDAGIGIGSTVAQLEAAYGLQLTIPGLPAEFGGDNFSIAFGGTGPDLLGSLSDTSATGAVTAIFTQVCE